MKNLWYAVNGSGQGVIFCSAPSRDEHRKIWCGEMAGVYCSLVMELEAEGLITLPQAMKWGDEPVLLELNLKICSEEPR